MLHLLKNGEVIRSVSEGATIEVEPLLHVCPAMAGWQWPEDDENPTYKLVQAPEPEPAPPPTKQELAAYSAQKRFEKEVGGTIWNGWLVHTDRESQGKIIAERLAIEAGERTDPDGWKFADGIFRLVSNTDFIDLSNAVRQHVRDCFALEAAVLAGIEAGTITAEAEIDAAFSGE